MTDPTAFLAGLADRDSLALLTRDDFDGPLGPALRRGQACGFVTADPVPHPHASCPHCPDGVPFPLAGRDVCSACLRTVAPDRLLAWVFDRAAFLRWLAGEPGTAAHPAGADGPVAGGGAAAADGGAVRPGHRRAVGRRRPPGRRAARRPRVLLPGGAGRTDGRVRRVRRTEGGGAARHRLKSGLNARIPALDRYLLASGKAHGYRLRGAGERREDRETDGRGDGG